MKKNKKSGNVMQQPMDSYVCGINTSSESIPIMSNLPFVLSNSGTPILREK